jgi:hypothetical protein
MDPTIVRNVSLEIYRRFPEFKGVSPKVQKQSASGSPVYLLIFRSQAKLGDGKTLARSVRVVVNEQGKIVKVSTSR